MSGDGYANNNPYTNIDPSGGVVETAWDVLNVGLGVASFANNIQQGNYGAAAVDAVGVAVDGAAAIVPFIPGGAGSVIKAGRAADDVVDAVKGAKTFSKEKQALVEMAKGDKKTGMTSGDMQAYKDLNKQLPDPFPTNKVRGPESHTSGAPSSQEPHGHVGPVNHIPIRD